jgi:hypothetical protein
MTTAFELLMFMRVLIITLSAETSVRYFWWSYKTWRFERRQMMLPLLFGIACLHVGIVNTLSYYALKTKMIHIDWIASSPMLEADIWLAVGSMLHLIPCWRLSCGYNNVKIGISMVGRIILAFGITLFVLYWKESYLG